jgi:ATP-dependent DNA helicase RecQ
VGDFFRPNLRFRAVERDDKVEDVLAEIGRHPGAAGIVYCIRRADVDEMSRRLQRAGVRATAYHAGMDDEARTRAQERWIEGVADVVVATVAFGMGIDRADVRFVIHAAMPQSLEHYQQEAGRAGRDGAPASCVLFWKGADFGLWQALIRGQESSDQENKLRLLGEMYRYCTGSRCRHRTILEYFGQPWKGGPCGACDLCTGQAEPVEGSTTLARRILSCLARTGQRFGPAYLVDLLTGTATDRVEERGHRGIEEFGAIADRPRGAVFDWIRQMEDRGLVRREGEYGVLKLTADGARVLRGEAEAELYGGARKPAARKKKGRPGRAAEAAVIETVPEGKGDRDLFERLRVWRRGVAEARGVPAFMIFGDATLRALARRRPATPEALLQVKGIGPVKAGAYGAAVLGILLGGKIRP